MIAWRPVPCAGATSQRGAKVTWVLGYLGPSRHENKKTEDRLGTKTLWSTPAVEAEKGSSGSSRRRSSSDPMKTHGGTCKGPCCSKLLQFFQSEADPKAAALLHLTSTAPTIDKSINTSSDSLQPIVASDRSVRSDALCY